MAALSIGLGLLPLVRDSDPVLAPILALAPTAFYAPANRASLFQDAAGTTPVAADGDPVGLMLDQSGNGHHLAAPSAAARPVYRTDGAHHWLAFNGTSHELATATALPFSKDIFACLAFVLTGYNHAFPNILSGRGAGSADTLSQPMVYLKDGDDAVRMRFGSQVNSLNYGASLIGEVIVLSGSATGTFRTVDIGVSATEYSVSSALLSGSEDPLRISGFNRFEGRFYGMAQVNRVLSQGDIAATRAYFAACSGGVA